ncbi:MAG: 3' terminal RNA ribose 2'-O-methyltransferase Hen1, partial [Cyanobacteria bacterium P01_E01_bin.42]
KLYWEKMSDRQKQKIELWQGSLTYQDKRLAGFDAAAIVEVIEHLEENRLRSLERVVFEFARPKTVIITTPNAEYNVLFENMKMGSMRHSDHRFEWMRNEFENWAKSICDRYHYQVEFLPIGQEVENIGAPSQMGIFSNGN